MINGTTQRVRLDSFPSGADVFVNGVSAGKTPLLLDLKRKPPPVIILKKEGFADSQIGIRQAINRGKIFLSYMILFSAPVDMVSDALAGTFSEYSEDDITVPLLAAEEDFIRLLDGNLLVFSNRMLNELGLAQNPSASNSSPNLISSAEMSASEIEIENTALKNSGIRIGDISALDYNTHWYPPYRWLAPTLKPENLKLALGLALANAGVPPADTPRYSLSAKILKEEFFYSGFLFQSVTWKITVLYSIRDSLDDRIVFQTKIVSETPPESVDMKGEIYPAEIYMPRQILAAKANITKFFEALNAWNGSESEVPSY